MYSLATVVPFLNGMAPDFILFEFENLMTAAKNLIISLQIKAG